MLVVGLIVVGEALAQAPAAVPAAPSYSLWEFGTMPRPAFKQVLLGTTAVQEELKITAEQKKAMEETGARVSEKFQKARREAKDRKAMMELREALYKESIAAVLAALEPAQRDRLDQIQLQSQGPLAFDRPQNSQLALEGPSLAERLKLTDDQIERIREIVRRGEGEINKAATVPVTLDTKAGAPSVESIRKFVETPEFKAAKANARKSAREAWDNVIHRIEAVLTGSQREGYHAMVGAPFDLWKIRFEEDETAEDAEMVASALNVGGGGGGGGQRSDPGFDTKVANPAYTSEHPGVLFDEAHNNFHTTGGRYKPFAELIANDGYKVVPNTEKFTKESLARGKVLIIANALGAAGMGQEGASDSAFTEAECDAVRDWVKSGGALLFITDHAPFGSAAESLAKRFDVNMSKGYTSDPKNSEGGETSLVFSRKNNLLGDHPITTGRDDSERVNRVQTFTGQSLKGPAGSVAILKLGDSAVDEGDDGRPTSAAGRAQGLAFRLGEGRVVVMGEAAELSAQLIGNERFGMNVPGLDNRRMALNIMHWLSGLIDPKRN